MNVTTYNAQVSFSVVLDTDAPNALTPDQMTTILQAAMEQAVKGWKASLSTSVLVGGVAVTMVAVAPPAAPVAEAPADTSLDPAALAAAGHVI